MSENTLTITAPDYVLSPPADPPSLSFCLSESEEVLFFSANETRVYGKKIEDGPEKAREVYEGVLRFFRGEAPPPPASKKFYVVWAPSKTEGIITDSLRDAEFASTGDSGGSFFQSSLCDMFREVFEDADFDEEEEEPPEYPVTEVFLLPPT